MAETTDPVGEARQGGRVRAALRAWWPWLAAFCAAGIALAVALAYEGNALHSPSETLEDIRRGAREREIERMIETLSDVDSAKVLIEGGEGEGADGASVTLQMRNGVALGPDTASAVAGLVASAAPGLDPASIVVVDSNRPGQTHRLAPDADVAHEGAALLRLRAQVERALADKIRGFFAGMQIESVVVVSAELDLDRVKERMLELDPERSGGVVVKEERSSMPPNSPYASARAASGASANRPAQLPASRTNTGGDYRKTEAMVSWVAREVTRSSKGLAQLSASVVVFDRLVQTASGQWKYDKSVRENIDEYTQLVAHALGMTDAREIADRIQVKYLPSPWATPPVAATTEWPRGTLVAIGVVILGSVVFAVLGIAAARRRLPVSATPGEAAADEQPVTEQELSRTEALRREAVKLVTEDADRAAAVLGRWVAREV